MNVINLQYKDLKPGMRIIVFNSEVTYLEFFTNLKDGWDIVLKEDKVLGPSGHTIEISPYSYYYTTNIEHYKATCKLRDILF